MSDQYWEEIDNSIWLWLRDNDSLPSKSVNVTCIAAHWQGLGPNPGRIDRRMQVMREAGRIRLWIPRSSRPAHVRAHGWEVLGCPGDGSSEDGQWHWREGCEDCQRRTRPDPVDGVTKPPPIIAFECELRIEPSA